MGVLIVQLIGIYINLVILDVILSWVMMAFPRAGFLFTVKQLLDRIVEPALYPIRQLLRPYMRDMPIDLSPIVLIILLNIVQALAIRLLTPVPFG